MIMFRIMQDHNYSVPALVNEISNLVRAQAANIFIYMKVIKQIYLEKIHLESSLMHPLALSQEFYKVKSSLTVPEVVTLELPAQAE